MKAGQAKIGQESKKIKGRLTKACLYINCTYNNTKATLTNSQGDVIVWSSAGRIGFKGTRKSTSHAAALVIKDLLDKVKTSGLQELKVFIKGVGPGRQSAVRRLGKENVNVSLIKDITPIPHGGVRPPKPRRA